MSGRTSCLCIALNNDIFSVSEQTIVILLEVLLGIRVAACHETKITNTPVNKTHIRLLSFGRGRGLMYTSTGRRVEMTRSLRMVPISADLLHPR